eukprot:1294282-Alexandrium_andersonii.AAC.1
MPGSWWLRKRTSTAGSEARALRTGCAASSPPARQTGTSGPDAPNAASASQRAALPGFPACP